MPSITWSMSHSSFRSGWLAGRSLLSLSAFWVALVEGLLDHLAHQGLAVDALDVRGGTLPGRKPLMFSCGVISAMRASSFSVEVRRRGPVTPKTRLRPSPDFSTICMDLLSFEPEASAAHSRARRPLIS